MVRGAAEQAGSMEEFKQGSDEIENIIRTIDNIANDISTIFESNYVGKVNNNADGRSLLKAALVDYFTTLQNMAAIQNFETDDITVNAGTDSDAVVVDVFTQPVDSVEKIYITVNLS